MIGLAFVLSSTLFTGCDKLEDIFHHAPDVPSTPTEIIDVFYEERMKTISSISQYSDENSVVLSILTDNHLSLSSINKNANEATLQNIAFVNSQVKTDGVVHLGDMIAESLYKSDGKSNEELYVIMNDYINKVNALHEHTFIINGNHDGEKGNTFNQGRWLQMVVPLNDNYVVRKEGTPYFYYDVPGKGVRCVFMAIPDNTKTGTVETGFSSRLLKWLQEDALNVEDGTDIIMFSHIPVLHANYYHKTNGRLPNRDSYEGMCNAFNAHTVYTDQLVNVDFTRYSNSRIVAYISGHAHNDLLAEPGYKYDGTYIYGDGKQVENHTYENTLSFPVILIGHNYFNDNTSGSTSRNGGINYPRKGGTFTQDLWDTMIYNKSEGTLHFIRFGAGDDRHISIK